ncbi:hypothetical protein BDZ94DRAFT_1292900 [Collybia nuda]|uniref:Heterokaryon incompatibility domain-containing protein n=1 Tax=Collybia nuda TaxID=64659 RepID=A0A9P5XV94_9AGAR|nr:hypothetical protein BDZ94DRAFT_1292900 [Collybia nuda]
MAADDLAFASLLSRPRIRDHSGCGDILCNAYQTDETIYTTKHVEDGCECNFVGVSTSILIDALSKDKVPKIVITEYLELKVVSGHDYPYIAVSHVWADGLGNPFTNALPMCQLRRLRYFANKLYLMLNPASTPTGSPVGLWMDTLCIPVNANAKAYRKKAIQLLGKTFNEANAVLILDRELEVVESATSSFLELGLHILCSGWIKRLWTLQEASLASEAHGASKIYLQMRDEAFLYQKYDRDRRAAWRIDDQTTEIQAEERGLLNDYGVMLELGAQVPSIHAMRDMREGWSPFRVIYNALEHRSTSKAEDIPVCVAFLMGKNVSTILSATGMEQRMAEFYMVMREVPHGVIWCERPQKLSIKPFRWAPLSITACPQSAFMGQEAGICDSAGLHVRYRGFIFHESYEWNEGGTFPRAFNIISAETGEVLGQLSRPRQRAPWEIPLQQNLAVIMRQDAHPGILPTAAFVVVEATAGEDHEALTTEYVCRLVGYMYFQSFNQVQADGTSFRGHVTAADQMWCIT